MINIYALFNNSKNVNIDSNIIFINDIIVKNMNSKTIGGVINIIDYTKNAAIEKAFFRNCTAEINCGAISMLVKTAKIYKVKANNCWARRKGQFGQIILEVPEKKIIAKYIEVVQCSPYPCGTNFGSFILSFSKKHITSYNSSYNHCAEYGSGISLQGITETTMKNSLFFNNTGTNTMYIANFFPNKYCLLKTEFVKNNFRFKGMIWYSGKIIINNCLFINNTADYPLTKAACYSSVITFKNCFTNIKNHINKNYS